MLTFTFHVRLDFLLLFVPKHFLFFHYFQRCDEYFISGRQSGARVASTRTTTRTRESAAVEETQGLHVSDFLISPLLEFGGIIPTGE